MEYASIIRYGMKGGGCGAYFFTTLPLLYSNQSPNILQTCNSTFSSTSEQSPRPYGMHHIISYLPMVLTVSFTAGVHPGLRFDRLFVLLY